MRWEKIKDEFELQLAVSKANATRLTLHNTDPIISCFCIFVWVN